MHSDIKRAIAYFGKKHQGQWYADHIPYIDHCKDVMNLLMQVGYTDDTERGRIMLISGLGHDSMEDTATSYSDVKKQFGYEVAENIFCMTDEIGRNRKEKKEKTLPKIRSRADSIIIKLADRIVNTRFSIVHNSEENNDHLSMYKGEYPEFRWALFVPWHTEALPLWKILDDLMADNKV